MLNQSKQILNQEDNKNTQRRSRKDEEGRDFACECGKKYLSYPALYTHIKTKHSGKQPEKSQKVNLKTVASQCSKNNFDQNIVKTILLKVELKHVGVLSHLDQNAKGFVKYEKRIKRDQVGKHLFEVFNQTMKLSQLQLSKSSSLELVLVVFLFGIGEFVSETLFQYYVKFARLFRNCFKDFSQQIYDICFKESEKCERRIKLNECELAPIICEFFLRFYLPHEGKDEDLISIGQLMCLDFCNWMYSQKLSVVQVSMKKQNMEVNKKLMEQKKQMKQFHKLKTKEQGQPKHLQEALSTQQKADQQSPKDQSPSVPHQICQQMQCLNRSNSPKSIIGEPLNEEQTVKVMKSNVQGQLATGNDKKQLNNAPLQKSENEVPEYFYLAISDYQANNESQGNMSNSENKQQNFSQNNQEIGQ